MTMTTFWFSFMMMLTPMLLLYINSEEPVRAGRWAERVRTAGSWDWSAVVLEIDVT